MATDHHWQEVREMDVVPDEEAVRQLFDDLTVGQPDAPPDRFGRIRRRVRRHRLTQAAGTLAVVAVAAVVAVSLGTSAGGAGPSVPRLKFVT
jgi:hypothetical protein